MLPFFWTWRCSFSKLLLLWPPLTYKFYFLTASYFNPLTIQTRSSKSKLSGYYCFLQPYLPSTVWLWFWLQTSCHRWIQYGGLSKNFVRTALERWFLAWSIAKKLYVGKTFVGKIRKIYRNTSGLDYLPRKGTARKVDSLCIEFNLIL